MVTLIINIIGVLLIVFIVVWFWLYKPKQRVIKQNEIIFVLVKNGIYDPDFIQVQAHQPMIFRFLREDATPCAERVVFSALNINRQLPLKEPIDIALTFDKPGEYEFTCQMGMYRGKVRVV